MIKTLTKIKNINLIPNINITVLSTSVMRYYLVT